MNPVNYYAQRRTVVVRTQPKLFLTSLPIVNPIFYPQRPHINPQMPEMIYFHPSFQQHQSSHQEEGTQTEDIPVTPPPSPTSQNQPIPKASSSGNRLEEISTQAHSELSHNAPHVQVNPKIEIHIGQTVPTIGHNASSTTAASGSSEMQSSEPPAADSVAPPALPLSMLPAPNGITIPPPPQETAQPVQDRSSNQSKKCGNCCDGCCGCSPANKTYLTYALIAVCASLVIALVPILVTLLAKPKD